MKYTTHQAYQGGKQNPSPLHQGGVNIFLYLLIILSFLLWFSNTELLLRFTERRDWFTIASRAVFALAFAGATVLLIHSYPRPIIIVFSGVLDGFALYLELFPWERHHLMLALTAIYFSLYGTYIVVSAGAYSIWEIQSQTEAKKEAEKRNGSKLAELIAEKKRLQNRINATRKPEKRNELMAQKQEIEAAIAKLQG